MPSEAGQEPDAPPFSEADERQLCLTCLAPNDLSAHFCAKCGEPTASCADTEADVPRGSTCYSQAVERPRNLTVVLGIWLLFGGGAAFSLMGIAVGWKEGAEGRHMIVFCVFMLAASLVILWRTTRNYRRGRRTGALLVDRAE